MISDVCSGIQLKDASGLPNPGQKTVTINLPIVITTRNTPYPTQEVISLRPKIQRILAIRSPLGRIHPIVGTAI
ncbi:hypothetical protein C9I71_29800 [Pseudomonas aeruginosa]|nr:hypothetical protein C9I71_29800 [Pseudomonas aeruginosa]